MPPARRHLLTLSLLVAGVVGLALIGCRRDTRTVGSSGGTGRMASSSERSRTLLDSAANQLADLPEQSILQLRPPSVVLDATKSADGQDVLAELTTLSTDARPIYNVLRVPARNGRFRAIGIRPGDMVKWYADQQSELESEFGGASGGLSPEQVREIMKLPIEQRQEVADSMMREMQIEGDIISTTAFEFPVSQVVDNNTLMVDLSTLSEEQQGRLPIELPLRMEIYRYRDSRFSDLVIDLNRYALRGVPLLGWEPSPDLQATEQIVERLNQWLRQTTAKVAWKPTTLIETLPETLRGNETLQLLVSDDALDRAAFSLPTEELRAIQAQGYEGRLLQEATWMRDISNWVTASELENTGRADRLFDWTVRNLQLDEDSDNLPSYRPWQMLAHGHATAEGRAWVFAQLCRQQDVPVVVFRPAGEEGPIWCGALVDGDLYLYDPALGLAILNSEGNTATLAQIVADPELLRSLDLDGDSYLSDNSDIESLTAEIVAGPFALSRRAALLEERLTAGDTLLVAVDVDPLGEELTEQEGVESVELWPYPYHVLVEQIEASRNTRTRAALEFEPYVHKPQLWKARLLTFRGAEGRSIDASRGDLEISVNDHRDAGRLYTSETVRPPDKALDGLESDDIRRVWTATKENATYWQGLLSFDRGDYQVASNWLDKAQDIDRWHDGATYNQARAWEALGKTDEAIAQLESSEGPQARGNRLRANRLREKHAAQPSN